MKRVEGSVIAEGPVVIYTIFLVLAFPMINLVTVGLRSYFLYSTTENAVLMASRATTYTTPVDGEPTATSIIDSKLPQDIAAFSEIELIETNPHILVTDIETGDLTIVSGPLSQSGDSSRKVYELEVRAKAQIRPFISMSLGSWGAIPGLTAPMVVEFNIRHFVESPESWNI
jgi:hypothetical protein